jgi:hypothetical protein
MNPLRLAVPFLAVALAAPAAPARAADKDDLSLVMEVAALQTLYDLKLTPTQLDALAKLVKDTAGTVPDRKVKISAKLRKLYSDLRDALAADNEDAIASLAADIEELKDSEKPDLDDDVELTDAGRKKAAEALGTLTARQVTGYLGQFAQDFPDPQESLTEALDEARKKEGKDWEEYRDATAGQVGWLIGGVDKDAEAKVHDKVLALLDRAHKLKEADFKDQKADLEKEARALARQVGPTEVIKNFMVRTMAELVSNPRAAAAIEARLKLARP